MSQNGHANARSVPFPVSGRGLARQRGARVAGGIPFRLTYTEEEMRAAAYLAGEDDPGEQWALVKRLSFLDRATIGALPAELRGAVNRMIGQGGGDVSAELAKDAEVLAGEAADLAAAFCRLGFVRPRLVETEDEIADPETEALVSDIHPEDRFAYLQFIQGDYKVQAERLMPLFRGPNPPGDAAEDRADGARLRGDPVPLGERVAP